MRDLAFCMSCIARTRNRSLTPPGGNGARFTIRTVRWRVLIQSYGWCRKNVLSQQMENEGRDAVEGCLGADWVSTAWMGGGVTNAHIGSSYWRNRFRLSLNGVAWMVCACSSWMAMPQEEFCPRPVSQGHWLLLVLFGALEVKAAPAVCFRVSYRHVHPQRLQPGTQLLRSFWSLSQSSWTLLKAFCTSDSRKVSSSMLHPHTVIPCVWGVTVPSDMEQGFFPAVSDLAWRELLVTPLIPKYCWPHN